MKDAYEKEVKAISRLLSRWLGNYIIGGLVAMWLWNGIVVDLIRVNRLTYWRAVGLVLLIHCLFPTSYQEEGK
jgi:hypothetical protein